MALTSNQIADIFQSKVGRTPTPEEAKKFSNASFETLGQLDKVNFPSPVQPTPTNVDVSNAVIPTNTPQTPTPQSTPQEQAPEIPNQYKEQHDKALSDYQVAQQHVSDIDKTLNDSFINKKKEIEAQGGIVNETQLRAQIANEQAPLINQRKSLVNSQSLAGKNLSDVKSLYVGEENRKATAKNQAARLTQAGQEFQQRQNQQAGQFSVNADLRQQGLDQKPLLQANTFNQQDKILSVKDQQAKDLLTLKSSLTGSNQTVSKELAQGIQEGRFDGTKINSRNIKIYNDLAKLGVDVVSSSLGVVQRSQITKQATKYQVAADQMAGILEKNMPTLIKLSGEVNQDQVDSTAINRAFIAGQEFTSTDPKIAAYVTALINARTEYANLVSRGGQATESTRAEAVQAIPAGYTPDQYQAVLDTEVSNAKNTYDKSQEIIDDAKNNTLRGGQEKSGLAASKAEPITSNNDGSYSVGAKKIKLVNGKYVVE